MRHRILSFLPRLCNSFLSYHHLFAVRLLSSWPGQTLQARRTYHIRLAGQVSDLTTSLQHARRRVDICAKVEFRNSVFLLGMVYSLSRQFLIMSLESGAFPISALIRCSTFNVQPPALPPSPSQSPSQLY